VVVDGSYPITGLKARAPFEAGRPVR
jgi:hypothetical protein